MYTYWFDKNGTAISYFLKPVSSTTHRKTLTSDWSINSFIMVVYEKFFVVL